MPLRFWNDDGDRRYLETYFDTFPGIWRHGDFIKFNERGGCYIYGRSDSTLNRFGVRIGTAEIYRAVEQVEEIFDCLARQLGVRYLHTETRHESPTRPVAALRREALAMLPQQLRKELADALVRLDPEAIVEVIDRVSKQDAQLGEVLAHCSKRFAYTEILSALEDCNGRFAEGSS